MLKPILFLIFFVFNLSVASDKIPAKVISITDGDTIKVLINGKIEKVRLTGIDTPESRVNRRAKWQARDLNKDLTEIVKMGKEAKRFVQSLISRGDIVYLEFDVQPRDRYGRLLAYVWLPNGKMLNKEIICNGYAMPLTIPPNVKYADEFRECFRKARNEGLGLWEGTSYMDLIEKSEKRKNIKNSSKCGQKKYCSQMTSCEEAKYYLNVCGLKRLDRDGDGIPCESLCK